ncbi:hypothetical protein CHS0354_019305 [Potamilus streckersoni]|uniref:Uncharacterized protein n=1 Tax=Potamilus streckersoni TaxID=2493646 RepID=A0AAE0VWW3_9BIVA|nr:hypothetical protein CHS0354_019305 [Potamilus streckersoni]
MELVVTTKTKKTVGKFLEMFAFYRQYSRNHLEMMISVSRPRSLRMRLLSVESLPKRGYIAGTTMFLVQLLVNLMRSAALSACVTEASEDLADCPDIA